MTTPTPNPSPQGGGEQTEFVERERVTFRRYDVAPITPSTR
jgi:hypothetical protein